MAQQLLLLPLKPVSNRKMDLLESELPETRTTKIKKILHANALPFGVPPNEDNWGYNCWGYVAFNFGWEKNARWLASHEMEEHLRNNTKPITKKEATVGDIAVFRRGFDENLAHTALVTHDINIICHKPGRNDLCVDSMKRAIGMYGDDVTYVRPMTVPA